jgi:phospholipid/cholesterol/gamma-HCH transport system permease protein
VSAPAYLRRRDKGVAYTPNIVERFFALIARRTFGIFRQIGDRVYFTLDAVRALAELRTYGPLTIQQMRAIGVDSLPLVGIVSAFIGAVTAFQTTYQLFPGVQLTIVGWFTRQTLVLELGPLLTALVLAGRVGARMTAEIGTMRVTEQIDALETLAYDPMAYLVVPRVIAGLTMVPLLTVRWWRRPTSACSITRRDCASPSCRSRFTMR